MLIIWLLPHPSQRTWPHFFRTFLVTELKLQLTWNSSKLISDHNHNFTQFYNFYKNLFKRSNRSVCSQYNINKSIGYIRTSYSHVVVIVILQLYHSLMCQLSWVDFNPSWPYTRYCLLPEVSPARNAPTFQFQTPCRFLTPKNVVGHSAQGWLPENL